jgi:VWFA-related protein
MLIVLLTATVSFAQTAPSQQNVPDAPSSVKKPPSELPQAPTPQQPPQAPPARPQAGAAPEEQKAPPIPEVKTVPEGGATPGPSGGDRDQLYRIIINPSFVMVPVTIKDGSGRLVPGLTVKDFTVLEDDVPQRISYFTSDPFPLSAAIVLDLGMEETTFAKVKNTLSALIGAFGQYDEVSIFTYTNTVAKVQDFTTINDTLTNSVKRLKERRAWEGGAPVTSGPMAQNNPNINGHPIDPGSPITNRVGATDTKLPSRVLNDAVLEAAIDLSHRPADRRKILFVISDGRESGSSASYAEVLKVLLTRQISVYGMGVGSAAIPGYSELNKIHIPGTGYGNLLPRYASATGGQVFNEFSQNAIEQTYARVTQEARNQYTIGYLTRATPSSSHRSIEVRVDRPGLKVYAREGYYPLPPSPRNEPQRP